MEVLVTGMRCKPHTCEYGNQHTRTREIRTFQLTSTRDTIIARKYAELEVDESLLLTPFTLQQHFYKLAQLMLYMYEGSVEEQNVNVRIRNLVSKHPETVLHFFSQIPWTDYGKACEQESIDYSVYVQSQVSLGSAQKFDTNNLIAHTRATHLLRLVNVCAFSFERMNTFIQKFPKNSISPAFLKHLHDNDPNFLFKEFPVEWLEAQYGVDLTTTHMHVKDESMFPLLKVPNE